MKKISFILVCTCTMFLIERTHGSSIGAPFYPLEPEDLTEGEIKELEYLEKFYHRPKRTLLPLDPISGSAGIINHLKTAAIAGTKHKIGAIASGSAGALTGALAGAVGAASAGAKATVVHVGKSVGGAVVGSAGAINHLKEALLTEATKKAVGVATGIAAAAVGSATAIKKFKTAALTGISTKIGQIASASAKTAAGASAGVGLASSGAVKHLKASAIKGLTGASAGLGLASAGVAKHFKTAALNGLASASAGIGQASVGAVKHLKSTAVKGIVGASAGIGTASLGVAGVAKHLTTAALKGFATKIATGSAKAAIGLATAGSSAIGNGAKGFTGAVFGSANFINQLKTAFFTGLTKKLGLIAAGSAKAATSASIGIKTKVGQVSADIAAGSADVVGQLKHAVVAGTKKKLGQAASGLAGAITGAVGSASAGAGQLARGVFIESTNLVNNLKTAVVVGTTNKIGQIASGSAGLASAGSAGLVNLKKAAVVGTAKKIGQVASASVGIAAGTAAKASSGIGEVKSAATSGITGALAGASAHITKSSVTGSVVGGAKHTIGGLTSGSVGKITGLSSGKVKRSIGRQPVDLFLDLPKRSESAWSPGSGHGSADIINQLKSALVSGLKKKIGAVAKGSAGAVAGASAGFSKGSFGGSGGDAKGYHHVSYEPEHSYEHKPSIDVWELKKSVLNTLLQAVKAIKGGVLAIKGQLIKGSGFVVAGSGKLLAAGGDKVTSLGKNIISNAVLVHPHKEHHVHSSEYGHPSASYSAPSGPPVVYDAPSHSSGPGPSYQSPYEHHYDHYNDKPVHGAHGIVLLKKIPSTKDSYHTSHSHHEESRVPAFKPLGPTSPSISSLVGKFFTASTSLDPAQPTSFGDTAHGETYDSHHDIHQDSHHDSHHDSFHGNQHDNHHVTHYESQPESHHGNNNHHPIEDSHATLHPPSPSYYEEPRTKFDAAAPPSFQAPLVKEHKVAPTAVNTGFSTSGGDFGSNIHPPSLLATNYGSPYEDTHNYLNVYDNLGAEASNKQEQKIKLTKGELLDHLEASPTLASSQMQLPKNVPQSFNALKSALQSDSLRKPTSSEVLPSSGEHKHSFEDSSLGTSLKQSPNNFRFKKTPSKSSFSQHLVTGSNDNSLETFLPEGKQRVPSSSKEIFDGLSSAERYQKYLEHFPFHKVNPSPVSSTSSKTSKYKYPQKLRMQSDHRQRRPSSKGSYSLVKSVSYQITPDGAKRLT